MKNILFVLAILFMGGSAAASGIDFFHGSWEDALEEASGQDKLIFVDGYAKWCGPCKRMARTVFTDAAVGEFFNSNFISMKMDMETPEGRKFGSKYPVSAYPTLLFIKSDGTVVQKVKGAQPADKLIALGKTVLSKFDVSIDLKKEYEKGNREPEFLAKYVQALNKSGKPILKVANEYLRSQEDLTTDFNVDFIFTAVSEADSRIFDLMIKNKSAIIAKHGMEAFDSKINFACENTLKKALEYESADLFKEAKSKMAAHGSKQTSAKFSVEADKTYYAATGDADNYMKAIKSYVKSDVKKNAAGLHTVAVDIAKHFSDNPKAMKVAEKYASKAADNGGLCEYYFSYATILDKNGKKKKAKVVAMKCKDLAVKEGKRTNQVEKLIRRIEG